MYSASLNNEKEILKSLKKIFMPFDEKCKKWRGSDILKKYANEEKPLLNKRLYRTEIYC